MINTRNDITSTLISDSHNNDTPALNFNDKVLSYLQQNQPEGSLNELLQKMRSLSPDENITLSQLNTALLKADATMRKEENYSDYTASTLDKLTTQLAGVNMLYNNMLYKTFTQTDDSTSS